MGRSLFHSNVMEASYQPGEGEVRTPVTSHEAANLVGSEMEDAPGVHMLVLDIDHRIDAVPSETPGHYHLYIDFPMPWSDCVKVLTVLAEVGIVEKGYANASIERGQTFVATKPWKNKNV